VDHGIETAEARTRRGKPTVGQLRIHVDRQASRLAVVVADDGAGLDPRRLKQVAIERGLLTPLEAVRLDDPEALMLITLPGFSTVEETNEVSGRGVGMDVVKHAVEAIGGRLRIEATPGRGARFELSLPPTVALVQTYLVRASGMAFAVPLASLTRMAPMDDHGTTWREGRRFWNSGTEEIPVWALRDVLGLTGAAAGTGNGMALIGESARGTMVGLEVDEVIGRREIVVRPLPPPLTGLHGYSGAAVLDDGSIVLVLDPASLPLV
jgi:two-component system chemotaxis sensor kinase CheA